MSGLFKKIAGAFVVMDEAGSTPASSDDAPMSQSDIDRILAETKAMTGGHEAPPPPAAEGHDFTSLGDTLATIQPVVGGDASGVTSRSFADIYTEAGVPATPKTAEQLLAIIEGFKALGPEATKIAITGLDTAEESWTINDPVLDAGYKIDALKGEKARLAQGLASKEAAAQGRIKATDAALEEATATIRQQIAEMEALLQEESAKAAQTKADINADLGAARDTVTRENARLDTEIGRLAIIPSTFGGTNTQAGE